MTTQCMLHSLTEANGVKQCLCLFLPHTIHSPALPNSPALPSYIFTSPILTCSIYIYLLLVRSACVILRVYNGCAIHLQIPCSCEWKRIITRQIQYTNTHPPKKQRPSPLSSCCGNAQHWLWPHTHKRLKMQSPSLCF